MTSIPSIPKGTRDFSPIEMERRNYIFDTIKKVFHLYGFMQIETPAMENLSTLLGKYGEEGDKLLFKVLNSGDYLSKISTEELQQKESTKLSTRISEKGLRYDLTVPFARYVVQNRNDITFPFKRYQMQPVWRADRPQKSRYREFYQCDADVVGSNSLLNEVELIQIIDAVFTALNISVTIKINNRKILAGIAEELGIPDKSLDIAIAIDKLDKIGWDNVVKELLNKGIQQNSIDKLFPIIAYGESELTTFVPNSPPAPGGIVLDQLKDFLKNSNVGLVGIDELIKIRDYTDTLNIKSSIEFDASLARGLNYYTGTIIEVKANNVEIGSICGGGRYDDLTGIFGLPNVSGVGISFGADRIYDVLKTTDKFHKESGVSTKIMFINFGKKEEKYCLTLLTKIRQAGINAEIFPDADKLKKQMNYANNKYIPFVALIGENEIAENIITLKDMNSGEQKKMNIDELISLLNKK